MRQIIEIEKENAKKYLPNVYRCGHNGFKPSIVSPTIFHWLVWRASRSRFMSGRDLITTLKLSLVSVFAMFDFSSF